MIKKVIENHMQTFKEYKKEQHRETVKEYAKGFAVGLFGLAVFWAWAIVLLA